MNVTDNSAGCDPRSNARCRGRAFKHSLSRCLAARWALATSSLRMLPQFLIIGAAKGGTSSLYSYMVQHPGICGAVRKEIRFFDRYFSRGLRWYQSCFPLKSRCVGRITGEATPSYLCYPHAAQRISEFLPDSKLVVLLRNPVDRAISHYHMSVRRKKESLPLSEAIAAEGARIDDEYKKMLADPQYFSEDYLTFGYARRGEYLRSLLPYEARFGRDRMFIESSERFFRNPVETLDGVFRFLGLDPEVHIPDMAPRNAWNPDRSGDAAVRSYLAEHFAPHNRRLYEWLGKDLEWEKE